MASTFLRPLCRNNILKEDNVLSIVRANSITDTVGSWVLPYSTEYVVEMADVEG